MVFYEKSKREVIWFSYKQILSSYVYANTCVVLYNLVNILNIFDRSKCGLQLPTQLRL